MKPTPTAAPADPVLLILLTLWLAAEALGALLIPAAACSSWPDPAADLSWKRPWPRPPDA